MEYIKIAKVNNVLLHRKGIVSRGTLHLTTHHLILSSLSLSREFWVSYSTIGSVFKNHGSALISKTNQPNESGSNDDRVEELYNGRDLWSFINIKVICKDYTVFSIDFNDELEAHDVYDSLLKLTVLQDITQSYAFIYSPNNAESPFNSWQVYDVVKEFERQGLDLASPECKWRLTDINEEYKFCPTYPSKLVVPRQVSDILLMHAAKYRSQRRIPVLTYYYKRTNCSITRAAQPLPGLTKQRSVQDERLVFEIFQTSRDGTDQTPQRNMIIDARPTANAIGQAALGGGSENMDNYNFDKTCSRTFLGIDNIHVMSDTLNYMVDNFLVDGDLNLPIDKAALNSGKSASWLKHIKLLLSSTDTLVKSIIFNKSNLLIHCSDGWDRTAQVCSLVQLCLDPYFRTLEGFMVLVEKDWLSFGHRFQERSGLLSSENVFHDNTMGFSGLSHYSGHINVDLTSSTSLFGKDGNELTENESLVNIRANSVLNSDIVSKVSEHFKRRNKNKRILKFTSPIFQQFLDCVYQLLIQSPSSFEFNERFLRRLVYHVYSCQYGNFLYNSEKERVEFEVCSKTRSVWDYFRSRKAEFTNNDYHSGVPNSDLSDEVTWILPNLHEVEWWWQLYGRKYDELNGAAATTLNVNEMVCSVHTKNIRAAEKEPSKGLSMKFPTFGLELFGKR
ncbi:hypothetical protein HG537_0B03640 [Torulaspora globosa]|uniref:Myotubularin phosphatase domain-containing protein n=1 Tax=Torulaspora globosa TaxID=48254 RepID=A0A7H9HQT5_9SACH|nr:hypothetical protein HG537_0B03640 [Torulaspora sp. CBS 2947]